MKIKKAAVKKQPLKKYTYIHFKINKIKSQ